MPSSRPSRPSACSPAPPRASSYLRFLPSPYLPAFLLFALLPCCWACRAARGACCSRASSPRASSPAAQRCSRGCVAARMAAAAADRVRTSSRARQRAQAASDGTTAARRRRGVRGRRGRAARAMRRDRRGGVSLSRSTVRQDWPCRLGAARPATRPANPARIGGVARHRRRRAGRGARIGDWRAGRRVRLPVHAAAAVAVSRSRRARPRARAGAARDDAGRHGEERRAGRGPGARQSGRRSDVRRARLCAARDRATPSGAGARSPRAIVAAIVIGDRAGPGRRRAAAAAGGRHLSRDRDLRRQHRDPRRAAAERVPPRRLARTDRDAVVDRRAARLRLARRRRRVGRSRDADGGRLLRRRARSISAARRSTRWRSSRRCWSPPIR